MQKNYSLKCIMQFGFFNKTSSKVDFTLFCKNKYCHCHLVCTINVESEVKYCEVEGAILVIISQSTTFSCFLDIAHGDQESYSLF